MDKKALDASLASLKKADTAVEAMNSAKKFGDLESAWADFLLAANRIFTKLEQGAKTNGTSQAWFGRKKHERKSDPLLNYIHHARNADEHTLASVTERTPPSVALGVGPGRWRFDGVIGGGPGDKMTVTALGGQVPGVSKFAEITPGKVHMVRVIDRGDPYDPPKNADGSEMHPREAAKLAFVHLKQIVEEAGKFAG